MIRVEMCKVGSASRGAGRKCIFSIESGCGVLFGALTNRLLVHACWVQYHSTTACLCSQTCHDLPLSRHTRYPFFVHQHCSDACTGTRSRLLARSARQCQDCGLAQLFLAASVAEQLATNSTAFTYA